MNLKYFKLSDFDCQETGENRMSEELLLKLDGLREACGFPFIITSGYRSPNHSIEAAKSSPGTHAQGIAVDIKTSGGAQRYAIIKHAMAMGFTGIGVAKSFIHVDIRTTAPVVWSY
jgi:zinc D-Ala-D-Ala carboxypeptidase